MVDQVRVVIIDDHPLFRTGVSQSLAMDEGISVVGEGASRAEARALIDRLAPDLVLLDISMPDNGIDVAREILGLPSPPLVVMLTVSEEDDDVIQALEAGAVGYILKGIKASDLIGAVKSVMAGESFVSPNLAMRLISNARIRKDESAVAPLSQQEQRTLRLVARGLNNREIADELAIQEKTVKFHVSNVMRKLKVRNRVEATVIARREWGELD